MSKEAEEAGAMSKIKVKLPKEFSGSRGESSMDFLLHFENVAAASKWSEEEMLAYFSTLLTKTALRWIVSYRSDHSNMVWSELRAEFIHIFTGRGKVDDPELELLERVYNEKSESVQDYFFAKVHMCDQIDPNMKQETKIRHILRGLPRSMQHSVIASDNLTTSKLLMVLMKMQSYADTSGDEAPVYQASAVARSSRVEEQSKGNSFGRPDKSENRPRSETRCFHCHKIGHTRKNCFLLIGYPTRMNYSNTSNRSSPSDRKVGTGGGTENSRQVNEYSGNNSYNTRRKGNFSGRNERNQESGDFKVNSDNSWRNGNQGFKQSQSTFNNGKFCTVGDVKVIHAWKPGEKVCYCKNAILKE